MDDEFDDCEHEPGVRPWPSTSATRINWTDPLIVVTSFGELLGGMIHDLSRLAGSMLKGHSNTIAERQAFKRDAGVTIEALTRGESK